MSDPIIVEVTIAAPAPRVWEALRDPEQIRNWHGWQYDGFEDEINFIYLREDIDASADDLVLDTGDGRFALVPDGERTVGRITRPAPAGADSWDGVYDDVNEGWLTFVQQLRYYVERRPGGRRRTLFVEKELPVPAGEVWYRSARQTGVAVGDDVLVVVAPGHTVVSGYDLDDDAWARVTERLVG